MRRIDRYVLHEKIASGGMAAVYLGQMADETGQSRTVAIKRLHPHIAEMTGALAMFKDEARLSARVRHPNIVATLAVAEHQGEQLLVMEYVHGVSLSFLMSRDRDIDEPAPLSIAGAIVADVLSGLQAAHEATDEHGEPLAIVHRDVSPQNVIVGDDGRARVLDFGIAKAAVRLQTTNEGRIKGKLRYMSPEQLLNQAVSPRTDVYAAAVVLWELLTGMRLFDGSSEGAIIAKVLEGVVIAPSRISSEVSPELEALTLRGLSRDPEERFTSCGEMAAALRIALPPADDATVAEYVRARAGNLLRERAVRVAQIERSGEVDYRASAPRVAAAAVAESLGTQTVRAPAASAPQVVPTFMPAEEKTYRRRTLALALALIVGIAGISAFALRARVAPRAEVPHASASPPRPPAVPAASFSAPPAPPAPAPEPGVASSRPSASPAPDAGAPKLVPKARPTSTVPASTASARAAAASGAPPPVGTLKVDPCDPMFTVDANGIRRVKPECL